MTAYGAVISLKNTIDYILHSSHFTLAELSPTIIQEAYSQLQPLQEILERLDKTRTSRSRKKVNEVDGRIKDKIWEFEDKLESLLYQQILPQFPTTEQEQEQEDGDGGMEETSVSQFQGLLESLPLQFQFQSPSPNTTNIQRRRRRVIQVDGDGGIKETRVGQFQGSLLESSHIPSQFEFQSPPPQQVEEVTATRRRVVHKHKGDHSLLKSRTSREKIRGFEDKLGSSQSQFELQSPPPEQVELTTRTSGGRRRRRRQRGGYVLLFSIDLHSLQDDVASFIEELKDMEKEYIYELENMPLEPFSTTIGFDSGLTKSKMIGLSDLFERFKGYLMEEDHGKHVQQIIGTAGIGKTALAKELYEDADIVSFYDCRAWITVTRTMVDEGPRFDEVLQGIVAQLCGGDTLIQGDDQKIADYLKGKKCLIVLDDVWEEHVFRCLIKSLPDIKNGLFYILLTTRGMDDLHASRKTQARFLNEEESKDLLCHRVFGGRHLCPDHLYKAAAEIAKKCEGLPLMIVTVADILSKSQITELEYWNDVAEERNSVFSDAYKEISEVLFPSYDYLPQYLKMPFLYIGVFPPDYEVPLSKLINLLNAEGWFFDTNKKQFLNDSVWDCLHQLCNSRYLVLFKRKSIYWYILGPVFKYKTCWLHSSWRYVCREEARKNKFYHVLNHLLDALEEGIKGHRCLCLQNNILFGIKEFRDSVRLDFASFTRSLLFLGPYHQYPTPIDVGFRLLRELDALKLRFYTFPPEILTLVQLKYLALTSNGELPTTISKLFNLQFLIIHPHMNIRNCTAPSYVPIQIRDMKELEHIEILGKSLRVPNDVTFLEKLLTLVGVNASISTIIALSRRIPNIRKLDVRVELTPYDDHNNLLSCFARISTLESLKILKCRIINPVIQNQYIVPEPPNSLMLPCRLKKLHLSGMGFPWEYMDVIGSLQNLEVHKLRFYAFRGSSWEVPEVGSFRNLEFLLIEDCDLVCLTLSRNRKLTHVSIKHCYKLERIHWPPRDDVERKVELVDCNPLAMTWAMELEPSAYSSIDVTISSSFEAKPMIINFTRHNDGE